MIVDERTTTYVEPSVPLSEREDELHIHYASNAIVRGHDANCTMVTTPRNWPRLGERAVCTCECGWNG